MIIIIRCSDPRINKFIESAEITKKFGMDQGFGVIANTGSIKYFMAKKQMNDFFEQLDILVHHFNADRIVLLNHTDCGFYKKIDEDKEEFYLKDLKIVKDELSNKFPKLKIEGYLMDTLNGNLKKI
jgi:carbonic anhydrase